MTPQVTLVLVGPTAVGKSRLAVALALELTSRLGARALPRSG